MALTGGSFNVKPFSPPPVHSVNGSWEFLLMEAARMRDEAAEGAAIDPCAQGPDESDENPSLRSPVMPRRSWPRRWRNQSLQSGQRWWKW